MGIFDWVGKVLGTTADTPTAPSDVLSSVQFDPNAFQYGGVQGGANAEQARQAGLGDYYRAQYQDANQGASNAFGAGFRTGDMANQGYAQQAALAGLLQNQAVGQGPSVAQAQLQSATDANIRQQMALANSARGGGANLAAAQYQAAQNAALAQQQAGQQAAQLRAQEMLAAREQLGGVLGQQRGQSLQQMGAYGQLGAMANQQAGLAGNLGAQYEQNRLGVGTQQMQGQMAGQQAKINLAAGLKGIQAGQDTENAKSNASLLSSVGGAAAGAAFLSDRRAKEDVSDASDAVREMLSKLAPKHFRYKQAAEGERPHVGIMAQDLEKSRAGASLVIETPHGKMVDAHRGLAATLAAQADLHARLSKLEEKHGRAR